MTHYICTGGCGGVSDKPGVCQALDCPEHGKTLKPCDCKTGKHEGALIDHKDRTALLTRNIVFGIEDSLVSTVALLSGIAAAKTPQATIIIAGIVLIVVEAISMAVGSFLSEEYARESIAKKDIPFSLPLWGGAVMFFSYFLAGFIPLLPYALFEVPAAFYISIACSLIALFALGSAAAKRVPVNALEHGLKMVLLGGFAITIGVIVGNALRAVF